MVTSEKRARTAATIENRMKTMAERLETKDSETVGSPSSSPPSFYTATQGRLRDSFPIGTRPRAQEPGEALRASYGSEFLTHAVTAGEVDNMHATIGDPR